MGTIRIGDLIGEMESAGIARFLEESNLVASERTDWSRCRPKHRWVLDKLLLSQTLGYRCGPAGHPVPEPGEYVVRPVMNINGMGAGARIERLESCTDHLEPGYFWCEAFDGDHISVDYAIGHPVLVVRGFRRPGSIQRFHQWERVPDELAPDLPEQVSFLATRYIAFNAEFIGGRLIEVNFHLNSDFSHGNDWAVPVYDGDNIDLQGLFVHAPDGDRIGLIVG